MKEKIRLLKQIEGKHTIETLMKHTGLTREYALNVISMLRKKGYVRTEGGGKQKRIYTISARIMQKGEGLFTILNRYSRVQVIPPFIHIAHGQYSVENALIDAIELRDFRILQATIYLFGHIKNWTKLHNLAKKKHLEPIVGVLYEFARRVTKTKRMPEHTLRAFLRMRQKRKIEIIPYTHTDSQEIKAIENRWNVRLPFSKHDMEEMR